jgi:hypothetical protein
MGDQALIRRLKITHLTPESGCFLEGQKHWRCTGATLKMFGPSNSQGKALWRVTGDTLTVGQIQLWS